MKDVEVITIDNKKYAIVNEVEEQNTTYVYLSNIDNPEDVMIRKSCVQNNSIYVPLDDEDEFYLATLLLFRGQDKKDGE